jgi:hypothetical protein
MWGAEPFAAPLNSILWVSQASLDNGECPILRDEILTYPLDRTDAQAR